MAKKSSRTILRGIGVSPGQAQGKVKIIQPEKKFPSFQAGDILVARITDPTMVVLMARARAIICDIGGMTSHPSIVSREMGIPCVVATKKATRVLKNGMMVKVDGKKGEVYLV